MKVNWRAVAYGFLTAIVLGLVAGWLNPANDATTPTVMTGLIGLIAGFVGGYFTKEGIGAGAIHGGLATAIGSIVVFATLAVFGLLFEGLLASFGIAFVGAILVIVYAIPGMIGGALGGWLEGRRATRAVTPTSR